MIMTYDGHSEHILLVITWLGKQSMILGMTWLNKHNPEIDFCAGTVKMTRCLPQCCVACWTERRDKRKAEKKFAQQVNTCCMGPFPVFVEDADNEDDEPYVNPEPPSDAELDGSSDCDSPVKPLEEGNCIWAMGLLPQAEQIRATAMVSQGLAEGFRTLSQLITNAYRHTSVSSILSSPKTPLISCQCLSHGIMQSNLSQMQR